MHKSFEHAEHGVGYARVHAWPEAAAEFQEAIRVFGTEPPPITDTGMPERFWPAIWHGRRVACMLLKASGGTIDAGLEQYIADMDPTREYCEWTCEVCPFHDCVSYVMQGARMMIQDLLLGDRLSPLSSFGEKIAVMEALD